jgi:3-oxoacyl-[acyl-carrier protein] reductase
MSLRGKVVVVTGSSKGIGFEIAKEFSQVKKSHVIVCSRSLSESEKAAKMINGSTLALEVDVTSESSVKKFINEIVQRFGRIDVLVNNSGYPYDKTIWNKKIHEGTTEELWKIIDVDLMGAIRLTRAVLPIMLQPISGQPKRKIMETEETQALSKVYQVETTDMDDHGNSVREPTGGRGGVIITISSTPAISGRTGGFPYTIAKSGNISLTKCIAKEYGNRNIRAYSLALGNITTKATYESITEEVRIEAAEEAPMKRWGKPIEVAKVAACISDDDFSFATGNTIVIDGGTVIL